jgi:hypothetical protein
MGIRFGQRVVWRGNSWQIVAELVAPGSTVYVSRGSELPGVAIPPEEWGEATYDLRGQCWRVPSGGSAA